MTRGLPDDGKLFVLAPAQAALAVERHPEQAHRVYTLPGIPADTAYVIDIDAIEAKIARTIAAMRFE